MKRILCLVLACFIAKTAVACLNESGTTLKGHRVNRSRGQLNDLLRSLCFDPKSRGEAMEQRLRGKNDFASRNDYAVALVLLGRNVEAISLLEEMVKETDPAVASLLFDYAALEAATATVENARQLLDLAVKFGYPIDKVLPLYAQIDHAIHLAMAKKVGLYVFIGFCVVGFIVYSVK